MAPPAAFAEVLDAYVDRPESRGPAADGRRHSGIATPSLFWFEGVSSVAPRRHPARPQPQSVPSPLRLVHAEVIRPKRTLSQHQREALSQLVGLGATLDPDFTLQELRSEFRALARAYHPDRHHGTKAGEKARLSTAFVTLRHAYETLKTAA
jgi:hypothetical protein